MLLLPQSYEELIPEGHLVRVVNQAEEQIDVESLVAKYAGGDRSSYHPKIQGMLHRKGRKNALAGRYPTFGTCFA